MIQDAIKLAIEKGGYRGGGRVYSVGNDKALYLSGIDPLRSPQSWFTGKEADDLLSKQEWGGVYKDVKVVLAEYDEAIANRVILDPAFWQALGKAKGWPGQKPDCGRVYRGKRCSDLRRCSGCGKGYEYGYKGGSWRDHAMFYLSTLLTEGQEKASEYLASLL